MTPEMRQQYIEHAANWEGSQKAWRKMMNLTVANTEAIFAEARPHRRKSRASPKSSKGQPIAGYMNYFLLGDIVMGPRGAMKAYTNPQGGSPRYRIQRQSKGWVTLKELQRLATPTPHELKLEAELAKCEATRAALRG